ncbi:MAG: phospholipase D family protein [Janthinobacterium lividum]
MNAPTAHRHTSTALPADSSTPLRAALAAGETAHPQQSAFRLLSTGSAALSMRIALAQAAQRTLDLQYYIAEEDNTGKLLLESVLRAADRGVRVRLLLDDFNFKDIDSVIATLNSHPHIEVRVFNPFAPAHENFGTRASDFLTRLDTLTRRMHNKAMIADNQVAIVGGRNIGDEYFDASPSILFRDLDVLAAGPIVPEVSQSFDTFWNSDLSYPLTDLNRQHFDAAELQRVRADLRAHWQQDRDVTERGPLTRAPLAEQIRTANLALIWAPAAFWADTPEKITAPTQDYSSPPANRIRALAEQAQKELLIISAYFVPGKEGVTVLTGLAARGVTVKALTNSLASTDAPASMAGYIPYRVGLLRGGVQLYEFKPVPGQPRNADIVGSRSRASLHTKALVIDRRTLLTGSINLDPRSFRLNTEIALEINSPEIAQQAADLFVSAASLQSSYQVSLADAQTLAQLQMNGVPRSPLIWTTDNQQGREVSYNFDPEAGLWRNTLTGLFRILPIQSQL